MEACSSFIRSGDIPQYIWNNIRKLKDEQKIHNASGKTIPIVGNIYLIVQIGTSTKVVNFLVPEKLATSVILGCYICDRHVETIKARLAIVEIDDGYTVPIVRQPSKPNKHVPIPEEQCFCSGKRASLKINIAKRKNLRSLVRPAGWKQFH